MKSKILFILICNLLICNLLISQSINTTLGTLGVFTIKDASNNYFTLSQSTGQVNILKTLRLENTTSPTVGTIFKGTDRFIHNYGTENTFMGVNSGNFSMTGALNTALGTSSLYSNTTGSNNTAVGWNSLYSNSTGNHNTALGVISLYSNTTGSYNTALGMTSLYSNTTGINNTAVGYHSLYYNTSNDNTAVGCNSLSNNYTGSQNTAMGLQSLYINTTGSGNTAVGWYSLSSCNGSQNTAIGHHSLQNNSTGNYNTAIGYNAGSTITTGGNLTCIGIDANPTSPTASDQITLGNIYVSSLRCNVTTITSLSDLRDKKNIKDLSLGLDFITKLKPRQFNWDKREWYEDNKSDGSKIKELPTAGFIAQELDSAQTNANAEWLNLVLKDNPEKWEATPGNLLPIVVKAIQDLKAENDILREDNEKLSAEVESLKSMNEKIVKLEQMMNDLNTSKNTSFNETK